MQRPVVAHIFRQMLHGGGGAPGKRGHRGMVQVDEPLPDGKLRPVFFDILETHLLDYTSKPGMNRLAVVAAMVALLTLPAVPADKKKDVNEIGNRGIGKCINFYSLEKEIGLGKQLAEEVE